MEEYRLIPLHGKHGEGRHAKVSPEDYERLLGFRWKIVITGISRIPYVVRYARAGGRKRAHYLHREVMQPPEGMVVDHMNHDTLDNRRRNLRVCTYSENLRHRRPNRGTASRYKGVRRTQKGQWASQIMADGVRIWLGTFESEEAAARAYDKAAKVHHGAFAYLNYPD